MVSDNCFGGDLTEQVKAACVQAREETLAAGVSVSYHDAIANIYIMEEPNGRKFEIAFIPNLPGAENYKVLREVSKSAA